MSTIIKKVYLKIHPWIVIENYLYTELRIRHFCLVNQQLLTPFSIPELKFISSDSFLQTETFHSFQTERCFWSIRTDPD